MVRAIPPGDLCDTAAGGQRGRGCPGGGSHNAGTSSGGGTLDGMAAIRGASGGSDGTNREMPSSGRHKGAIRESGRDTSIPQSSNHPDQDRRSNTARRFYTSMRIDSSCQRSLQVRSMLKILRRGVNQLEG